jgi:hypothetical protein
MTAKTACGSVLVIAGFVSTWASAQGIGAGPDATPSKERSIAAETTAAAYKNPKWRAPRTSWGDPSLDGQWSVDDMRGIPRDRPENQGTRESLTPEEFLKRASQQQGGANRARQEETFLRNEWGTRTFGYSSLVVDPPNGRVPELTAAGKARAQAVAGVGTFGPGPFDKFEDFSLYDRRITRGIFGSVLPSIYGNGIRIAQSPTEISVTYEMTTTRGSFISTTGRTSTAPSSSTWATRSAIGKATPSSSRARTSRPRRASAHAARTATSSRSRSAIAASIPT